MSFLDRLKVYSRHVILGHAVLTADRLCEPAVVISGASEGIGRAFAELLIGKGFTVLLLARNIEALEDLAEELHNDHPQARLETLGVDVTSSDAAAKVAAELRDRNLYADVLINNAGIGLGGRFESHTIADCSTVDRYQHWRLGQANSPIPS
jgi:short-subunit dehydrogenase